MMTPADALAVLNRDPQRSWSPAEMSAALYAGGKLWAYWSVPTAEQLEALA